MKNVLFLIILVNILILPSFAQSELHGPTKPKDTLWSIAVLYLDEYEIDKKSLVYAFHRLNPRAFVDNDINRLMIGVYLVKPTIGLKKKNKSLVVEKKLEEVKQENRVVAPLKSKNDKSTASKTPLKLINSIETTVKPEPIIINPTLNNIDSSENEESSNSISTTKTVINKKASKSDFKVGFSYELLTSFDDNMRLAQNEADIRSDVVTNFKLKASFNTALTKLSRFSLSTSAEHEGYSTFDTLDNLKYDIEGKYLFINDTGFYSPVYIFSLALGGIESESVMRTSNTLKIGLNINKRLTTHFHSTFGLQLRKRESQSEVFDLESKVLFANIDYSLARSHVLYGTYHYIVGDSVSSASPSLWIVNSAEAIEQDDAFGGADINQFAYKVETQTHVLTLGWNKAMSRALSFDVSARYVSSEADKNNNIEYQRIIYSAGILGKF